MMMLLLLLLSLSVQACVHRGIRRVNGETWVSNTNFFMRCTVSGNAWSADIVGCVTDGGHRIAVGDAIEEDDLIVECVRVPSGVVEFRRKRHPRVACDGHRIGETWIENTNFRKQCMSDGRITIMECITDGGVTIAIGSYRVVNGVRHTCKRQADNSIVLERELALTSTEIDNRIDANPQVLVPPAPLPELPNPRFIGGPPAIAPPGYFRDQAQFEFEQLPLAPPDIILSTASPATVPPPSGARPCFHEGVWRQPEETWISDDKFTKKCTPGGATVVLNCIVNSKENVTIKIDSKIKIGRKVYTCTRKEGSIFYEERTV